MAYITQANASAIIRAVDPAKLRELAADIFGRHIPIFSKRENGFLQAIKQLFIDPINFVKIYLIPKEKKKDNGLYVFIPTAKPCYHAYRNCERLFSGFSNYMIPEEIRLRGDDEVKRYREWFVSKLCLLHENPDRFLLALCIQFKLQMHTLGKVNFENSGREKVLNISPEELETRIEELLKNINEYSHKNSSNACLIALYAHRTGALYSKRPIANKYSRYTEDEIRDFLQFFLHHYKKPLQKLLIEYYRIKYNSDIFMDKNLLESLGFQPCSVCTKYGHTDPCSALPQGQSSRNIDVAF